MNRKEQTVLFGTGMNVFLSLSKFIVGILSGSIGLMADGIHSASDTVASIALFIGIKLSNRKTKTFPHGMYKLENLISLFTAFAIFFAGYEILREVLFTKKIYKISHLPVALSVEAIAILITFFFSRFEAKIGRKEESPGLIADSMHVKSDMFSSIIIVVGLLGGLFGVTFLDKIAAVIVAIFVFKAGYEVALNAAKVLLDASIDYSTLDKMKQIIKSYPLVKEIKEVNGRNSGSYKFLDAIITLKTSKLDIAHHTVTEIEKKIKQEISHVDSVIIHYEPAEKKNKIIAIPMKNKTTASDEFGSAPYFLFIKVSKVDIVSKEFIKNVYANFSKGKGIKTAEWLAKNGVDVLFLKAKIKSKGPLYVFENFGIGVKIAPDINIEKLISLILKGKIN